jgi:5-hydroxyisourate hydrolase-like protein (transthyretin family)
MKRRLQWITALGLVTTLFHVEYLTASSCKQLKSFEVQQLCGLVIGRDGVPIPGVVVELVDLRTDLPDIVQTVTTDNQGKFKFADAPVGEYALSVHKTGFAPANQNFRLLKQKHSTRCRRPINVRLELAGSCSSVMP